MNFNRWLMSQKDPSQMLRVFYDSPFGVKKTLQKAKSQGAW